MTIKINNVVFTILILSLIVFNRVYSQDSSPTVIINEFLAQNMRTIPDTEFDEYSDWIELFNVSNENVDLSDYYLSDDSSFLHKWKFPQGTIIESEDYLIIWADGRGEQHTNFKLNSDGEQVFLSDSEAKIIDSISFSTQFKDISFGRAPDNHDNLVYFPVPTFGKSNSTFYTVANQKADKPTISVKGGIYNSAQIIQLYSADSNSEIRYTQDGSVPTHQSKIYSSPLYIATTSVVTARVFADNYLPSNAVYNTYIINENIDLPIVSVITDPDNFWNDEYGIYTIGNNGLNMRGVTANYWQKWERPVHIELYEYGERVVKMDAGIAINGARRNMLQKSFRIFARGRYGDKRIEYKLFDDKSIENFSSIILRNGGYPEFKFTLFKDGLLQSLISSNMDMDYQSYKPAVLLINGEYWGIYNIREKQNEDYLEANHGIDPDSVDILENRVSIVEGDAEAYNNLIKFIEENDMSIENNYEYIKTKIDIDEYLNYQIAQIYIANIDWPANNIKYWRPRTTDGKWRWLLFDIDAGTSIWSDYNHNTLEHATAPNSTEWNNLPWSTFLFRNLLESVEFRNEFIQRSCAHINSTFNYERFSGYIDEYKNRIDSEINSHIERWSAGCDESIPEMAAGCVFSSKQHWNDNIERVRRFAANRPEYLIPHIQDKFGLDSVVNLTINSNFENAGTYYVQGVELLNELDGNYFKNIPLRVNVIPKSGYEFAGWEGIIESENQSVEIMLEENSTLKAVFEQRQVSFVPNVITGHVILNKEDSPYLVVEDVEIKQSGVLEVRPGVELFMDPSVNLIVGGTLKMIGTLENSIIIKPNTSAGADKWGAIIINDGEAHLEHVNFSGATHGTHPVDHKAAISSYNSILNLDFVFMDDVEFPIFVRYGNTTITNSSIHSTVTCDLINVKYGTAIVENCVLRGSEAPDTDAIDYDEIVDGIIRGNKIYNFLGENCDGIDLGEGCVNVIIEDNMIFDCSDKGISIGQVSTGIIRNNIIGNCSLGIGIKDQGSYALIKNTTFYENGIAVSCFEKNLGSGGGSADVVNTIFSESETSSVFADEFSSISVTYSLSDSDIIDGTGNIYDDPGFVNAELRNFKLLPDSPCIDTGDPQYTDQDGSISDIGADIRGTNSTGEIQNIVLNEINYNSSDYFDTGDWIELFNPDEISVDLSGWMFTDNNSENLYRFPNDTYIDPSGYSIVSSDVESFELIHQDLSPVEKEINFGLSSEGETLTLFNSFGEMIDIVTYGTLAPWPTEPNGNGFTLELINPYLENDDYTNWAASPLHGTPGRMNSVTDATYINLYELPLTYSLYQNYPNPFNPTTTIEYSLQFESQVKLEIYNILGQKIGVLVNGIQKEGMRQIEWDANRLASGVYILRLFADPQRSDKENFLSTRKMILLR